MAWYRAAPLASPTFDPSRRRNQKLQENVKNLGKRRNFSCKSMVQQMPVQGATAAYAREMERLSAKESLLLAVSSNLSVFLFFRSYYEQMFSFDFLLPFVYSTKVSFIYSFFWDSIYYWWKLMSRFSVYYEYDELMILLIFMTRNMNFYLL